MVTEVSDEQVSPWGTLSPSHSSGGVMLPSPQVLTVRQRKVQPARDMHMPSPSRVVPEPEPSQPSEPSAINSGAVPLGQSRSTSCLAHSPTCFVPQEAANNTIKRIGLRISRQA